MPSDHRLHPSSILFALGGSLRSFLLPAVVLMLTSGRSSPAPSGPPGWGPAAWMNRWMPGNFEIANWQFWLLLFLIPATIAAKRMLVPVVDRTFSESTAGSGVAALATGGTRTIIRSS